MTPDQYASVRYLAGHVQAIIDFCITHPGSTPNASAVPMSAGVVRGPLRLLMSGPASSGARATPADAGRNRIHLVAAGNLTELFQPAHRPASPAEAS